MLNFEIGSQMLLHYHFISLICCNKEVNLIKTTEIIDIESNRNRINDNLKITHVFGRSTFYLYTLMKILSKSNLLTSKKVPFIHPGLNSRKKLTPFLQ